jgi:hypothetical protein
MRQGTVAVAALLISAALVAGTAHGAGEPGFHCKHVHSSPAAVDPDPTGRPPLAIGDSTMLLPIPNLNAAGFSVNARGCRGFKEAVEVMAKLRQRHRLPHLVLINAYSNGGVNPDLIGEALKALGRKRVLGLITEYDADTGHPPAPDTNMLFQAAHQHRHQIFVLDWVAYSRAHHKADPKPGAWFLPDLFHPNYTGAAAYATFLARALPVAEEGQFPPLRHQVAAASGRL